MIKKKKKKLSGDARKRRKRNRQQVAGNSKAKGRSSSSKRRRRLARPAAKDPSVPYLAKPLSAPLVRQSREFFGREAPGTDFHVHIGPTRAWRGVAKLSVRRSADPSVHRSVGLSSTYIVILIPSYYYI